jgi:HAD superfamily hydrolase (TIGR01662 family)
MVMGYPAAGKSSIASAYTEQGFVYLNRDKAGGKVADLVPKMVAALKAGKDVVLDNTFPTVESRKPFLEAAKKFDVTVICDWLTATIEDAQFNACVRMIEREGRLLMPEEIKKHSSPNMFPTAVLFNYRKQFQAPTVAEGFHRVDRRPFMRGFPAKWTNAAIILDYDGTLRVSEDTNGAELKWPTDPKQVVVLPGRAAVLRKYEKEGYALLGVSNQSGVAKGSPTDEQARACFDITNRKLQVDIEYAYCPHNPAPINCYCRKPMSGLGVQFIMKHNLSPSDSIMVGDQTTDRTFASRCGFQFIHADDFFG